MNKYRDEIDKFGYNNPQAGLDEFNKYMVQFGFGSKLGIDYPNESPVSYTHLWCRLFAALLLKTYKLWHSSICNRMIFGWLQWGNSFFFKILTFFLERKFAKSCVVLRTFLSKSDSIHKFK